MTASSSKQREDVKCLIKDESETVGTTVLATIYSKCLGLWMNTEVELFN